MRAVVALPAPETRVTAPLVDPTPVAPGTSACPQAPLDPLPLPQPGWGADQARSAVEEAALVLPALDGPAELVRALSTVVLRVGDTAVKVHPPGTCPEHLAQVHAVLADSPVALTATAPPVVTSHGVVTVTPWTASRRPVGWGGVGRVLRALHDLPTASALPGWTPLRRLPSQLDHLPASWAQVVLDRRALLLDRLAALEPVLAPGALHGDVSPENVLRTSAGPRWIDLDLAAHGLREYDLSAVVRRWDAGQVTDAQYARFVKRYGVDLRGWPGLVLLDDLCALSALGFRLWTDRCAQRDSSWLPEALGRLSAVPAAR